MTWTLSQTGASISGTFTARDDAAATTAQGTISGTLTGTSLSFVMLIPAGGYPAPCQTATANLAGTASGVTASKITASYSGPACGGTVTGSLSLSK